MAQGFIVHVDASDLVAGAMLSQISGYTEVVDAYFSQPLSVSKQRYRATTRKCYAVVLAIER